MNINYEKVRDEWNRETDEKYSNYNPDSDIDVIVSNPSRAFPKEIFAMIRRYFPDLCGKRVCVPSSGDNQAVFAFHLLGAHVTSLDISDRQLHYAKLISDERGWNNIEYILEDSMDFGKVKSDEYDLVYTSNGVHSWISDLTCMYRNFRRVLKDNGLYIMFELHPIMRPIDEKDNKIIVRHPYEDIGPRNGPFDIEGEAPCYHWRTQDIINGIIESGLVLTRMEEFHASPEGIISGCGCWYSSEEEARTDNYRKYDWRVNDWEVLPEWLGIIAKK